MKLFCCIQNKANFFKRVWSNLIIGAVVCVMFVSVYLNLNSTTAVSQNYNPVYYSGNSANNNVSLMVNVYWGTEYLDDMLNTFKENDVKATFFVGGMWVSKNNEMLKKIKEQGHELANHGFFHKDQKKISYSQNFEEIDVTHKLVKEVANSDMDLFAPPSGSFGKNTLQAAENLKYKTIMWSKDTIDWRDKDENLVFSRATKNLKNGDLILMHPTKHTAKALGNILKEFKKLNFNQVIVSENIK